jgi:hypothetical protein
MINLTCIFSGHKWDFPDTSGEQVNTVKYELVTCSRCGTKRRVLCYVTDEDE